MTDRVEIPRAASGATAIDVAWRCARDAGALALAQFRSTQAISSKGHRNVVTETDVACELLIKGILAEEYPAHAILSEETASDTDASSGWTWVVDPIDGTKNYSIGLPFWCVNVALCHDGEPVVGLTYDPNHGEGFWAIRDEGAFCNEAKITASEKADVFSAVLSMDLGYDDELGSSQLRLLSRIFPAVQGFRITGSAALGMAYAACGRVDLYVHRNISPWDVAPGILLIGEAGGVATEPDGSPMRITSKEFAAGGRGVHADFLSRYAGDGWG
jgi:fructose-1,6-bisphosphatase/inositol monophosphatase family enzyme